MKKEQIKQKEKVGIAEVGSRFFFFTYSYWCEIADGKGNLSIRWDYGFPPQENVKKAAMQQVKKKYNQSDDKISLVIESWIEMTESDFMQWLS